MTECHDPVTHYHRSKETLLKGPQKSEIIAGYGSCYTNGNRNKKEMERIANEMLVVMQLLGSQLAPIEILYPEVAIVTMIMITKKAY